MAQKKKKDSGCGRFNTDEPTKRLVWIRSAGHCELCGSDLTQDFRVGTNMNWGEVAHILPASPKGPRGQSAHDEAAAESLTNDPANLMLLCPSCHDKIDRDDEGYPKDDLSNLHQDYIAKIRLAATTPADGRAIGLIVLSQHFSTTNNISNRDLLTAMSSEGLSSMDNPMRIVFPPPTSRGRDESYWQSIKDNIQFKLESQLQRAGGVYGDIPKLAVVGLADIPALMMLGQSLGDRFDRQLFSVHREHRLKWPNPEAQPPEFIYTPPEQHGDGPLALVISISAQIPKRDVLEALPNACIAEITIPEPNYAMIQNRKVIHAFRDELQKVLSQLEAMTPETIHVFAAIPAVLAIEFGALLTTQHQHSYLIYDREKINSNKFIPTLKLGPQNKENQ